jgi:HD-GYP domain-containing protein (c-di-GMP phosphodiesterase class II)
VDEGLKLLDEFASGLSPRIRPLIQQHHEKYDGSGYPQQLQGSQVNDLAQLIGMADAIESMATGHWDGTERTFMQSFEEFERLEKAGEYSGFFNPEVFAAVLRWIRNPGSLSSKLKASEVVRTSTQDLMKRGRSGR